MARILLRVASFFTVFVATTSEAVERRHAHHHRHRLRGGTHSHHGRRHHRHEKKIADTSKVDEALTRLPAKLGNLYVAFQQDQTSENAATVLEQLNAVYNGAMGENDSITLDCRGKMTNLSQEVTLARSGLKQTQSRLTQVQDRMQSLQSGLDRSLAEIETLRTQFHHHKDTCGRNRKLHTLVIANLTFDGQQAKAIADSATSVCAGGGSPPELLECTKPDGIVVTFKDESRQAEVSKLSQSSASLLADALDASVKRPVAPVADADVAATATATATSLLALGRSTHKWHKKGHKHLRLLRHVKTHARHRRQPGAGPTPAPAGASIDPLCTSVEVRDCMGFSDAMNTFVGRVQASVDDMKMLDTADAANCKASTDSYSNTVAELKTQADDGNIMLANAVAEQGSLSGLDRQRKMQLLDISSEHDLLAGDCTKRLGDVAQTMCDTKALWRQASASSSGSFVGDCIVSAWVPGQCSKPCGSGGVQKFMRSVVSSAGADATCPPLEREEACNERPCPVDGVMGRWEEWGACSQPCGGGTRTRRRPTIQEAKFDGIPTGESMQEELCNQLPCDQDCTLGDWTEWSECSQACQKGYKKRVKHVVKLALGAGICSPESDKCRRQAISCNKMLCNETFSGKTSAPKCSAAVDLVFVLDGSGSVTSEGFVHAKTLVTNVLAQMQLMDETPAGDLFGPTGKVTETDGLALGARVGVVSFGSKATVVQDLSKERAVISGSVAAVQWPESQAESATNTAQALAVAREMFDQHADHADAKRVVVVITDGAPTNARLVSEEISSLTAAGARVSFVAVGTSLREADLLRWSSWPEKQNIKEVPNFAALAETDMANNIVTSFCPLLSFE